MALATSDFDYALDPELIAQAPLGDRDQSRLMTLCRRSGRVEHRVFADLPRLLRAGDVLVLNDTRVIPAKFACRRRSGGRIGGLFLHETPDGAWEVMLRGAGRCGVGEELLIEPACPAPPGADASEVHVELAEDLGGGRWRVRPSPQAPAVEILERLGRTPLPPYISRADSSPDAEDRSRYQTVYAARAGAVAAPTAGLHFSQPLMNSLREVGVETTTVTLHVGAGTFMPVKVEDLASHRMHLEWYELPAGAAEKLNAARRENRRIVAVGTTSVRVLETVARRRTNGRGGDVLAPAAGWTDLFLYPPGEFHAVDALITNFHLPRSTLLMLVAAFCSPAKTDGVGVILDAYARAIRRRYRFYSYGDAMLIE